MGLMNAALIAADRECTELRHRAEKAERELATEREKTARLESENARLREALTHCKSILPLNVNDSGNNALSPVAYRPRWYKVAEMVHAALAMPVAAPSITGIDIATEPDKTVAVVVREDGSIAAEGSTEECRAWIESHTGDRHSSSYKLAYEVVPSGTEPTKESRMEALGITEQDIAVAAAVIAREIRARE